MSIFFFIVGFVVVVITAPLIAQLSLVTIGGFLPKRKERHLARNTPTRLVVVVPAHNEEDSIGRCVQSLRASDSEEISIFVVAHNCTDSTAATAKLAGAEVLVYDDPTAKGKAYALRLGFTHAIQHGAEAVLVVDADSTVSSNLISSVMGALAAGAEAVQCRYEMRGTPGHPKSELVSLAVRGFNFVRPLGRQRLGLSAGILGNGFALSADLLSTVPYDALSVVEDLEYHLHLISAGKRVFFIDDAVVSSELPTSQKGEMSQHSRWQGGRLRVARSWMPRLLRELLTGRFAALEPALDLAGLPIAFGMTALFIAAWVPLLPVRLYVLLSLLVILTHVLRAIWAGPQCLRTLRLLALVPFYLFWKLRLIPNVLRASSAKAAWIRTDRKATARSVS